MTRRFTTLASVAALVALAACARDDNAAYDTAAGATAGAMATPPPYTPPATIGATTGTTTGTTTGATTKVRDTLTKRP